MHWISFAMVVAVSVVAMESVVDMLISGIRKRVLRT
jgi:hypothetical protein